jgi:hypothetical protein
MRGYNFLRLISNKLALRSYGCFPKFTIFFLGKNDIHGYVKNCRILLKMHKEI